tara:strand:- start:491 stop:697 length:207 start_codon:yes stop_codon:yes gene_type:complete
MFIFKTAKVWRDLAGEDPSEDSGAADDASSSSASLNELSKNTALKERDGTRTGTAPDSIRSGKEPAKD